MKITGVGVEWDRGGNTTVGLKSGSGERRKRGERGEWGARIREREEERLFVEAWPRRDLQWAESMLNACY